MFLFRRRGGRARGAGGSRLRSPLSWRPSASTRRMLITGAVFLILFIALFGTAAFWVNWWWFDSVGYRPVLTTRYTARITSFLVGGLLAAGFVVGNTVLALRRSRDPAQATADGGRDRVSRVLLVVVGVVTFLIAGVAVSTHWQTWLLWLNGRSFGVEEPVFRRDVGFYVFALPAWKTVQSNATTLTIATLLVVAVVYALRLGVGPRALGRLRLPRQMRIHLFALGGILLLLVSARYWLANFDLTYSTRGTIFGATYTDVNAQRWANYALTGITALTAGLLVLNAYLRRVRWLVAAIVAWGLLAIVLGLVYPSIVQRTFVEPSELRREQPYIEQNLAMTRTAYGLDDVAERELSGQDTPSAELLAAQPATINNIRLWDYRVIGTTYQQLQSFVPYYVFNDVDVDRYTIDGAIRQLLLSPRELDTANLPTNAQTWVNRHLVYTHGYGIVASAANGVVEPGTPSYLVRDIPPTGTGALAVTRPEIYFGEGTPEWVAVDTGQDEFTALPEATGATANMRYDGAGRGSIALSNYPKRLILAAHLGDRNILLSGALTTESRVLIRRNIVERASAIAPFLTYDPDPYLMVLDGRLVWLMDAYTATDRYPNASRTRGLNYLRNSVKVTVDAYDGTITFYRTTVADPIADAYGSIYPDLFTPVAEAPAGLAAHFRYPELLFNVQSEIYGTFHVADPAAYYNGDDKWAIAREDDNGTPRRMEPYYVTMTLPEEQTPGFTLIAPFTPTGQQDRQNMVSWLAARTDNVDGTDPTGNPRLVVYRFPRQTTVFGPQQIEARIDQEPDISAQVTLWNQSGSSVIRGNLLVIPIGGSLLYVQPLYLQATETQGAYPELKRVIVASSERVVMRTTLDEALTALTTGGATAGPLEVEAEAGIAPDAATAGEPAPSGTTGGDLAQQALETYERAQTALREGNWTVYGEEQERLRALLEQLAAIGAATPTASPEEAATPTP